METSSLTEQVRGGNWSLGPSSAETLSQPQSTSEGGSGRVLPLPSLTSPLLLSSPVPSPPGGSPLKAIGRRQRLDLALPLQNHGPDPLRVPLPQLAARPALTPGGAPAVPRPSPATRQPGSHREWRARERGDVCTGSGARWGRAAGAAPGEGPLRALFTCGRDHRPPPPPSFYLKGRRRYSGRA